MIEKTRSHTTRDIINNTAEENFFSSSAVFVTLKDTQENIGTLGRQYGFQNGV
jgi:hypothetical protein